MVRLDELGSFIWMQCTGDATIDDILADLENEMGDRFDEPEEMEKRTFYFFHMLRNRGLLTWVRGSREKEADN